MRRRRWALGLLLVSLAAPEALRAQAGADSAGLEPVIVELAIGRYGSRTVSQPIRANASRRSRTQPPAAPATFELGSFTAGKG